MDSATLDEGAALLAAKDAAMVADYPAARRAWENWVLEHGRFLIATARQAQDNAKDAEADGQIEAFLVRKSNAEDARRYRWLRDHRGNNRVPHVTQHPYCAAIDDVEYPYFVTVGLDAAVDAAIAAATPGKGEG